MRHPHLDSPGRRARQAGFTLMELVVALFVLAVVLVAMLGLFDATNKVARSETHLSELQQSLRIGHNEMVRLVRMTARGWVPGAPAWTAAQQVAVRDNVGPAAFIDGSSNADVKIYEETDVIRIRGVINGSIFQPDLPSGMFLEPSIEIKDVGPSGTRQDLDQLQEAMDAGNEFRLLLVSRLGEVAIVDAEVDSINSVRAIVDYDPASSTEAWLSQNHPIAFAGILEDYAFYVRDNAGQPRLSMARFKPGTNDPYGDEAENLRQDIADDIIDLQVALGIDTYTDTDGDGDVDGDDEGDEELVDAGDQTDEWFGNHGGDAATPELGVKGDLFHIRITTLARTQGRDFKYIAPPIQSIENRDYSEPDVPAPDEIVERSHRRRLLQTVVDLRNL